MLNEDYTLMPNGAKIFRGATVNLKPVATNTTAREIQREYKDTTIGENTVVYPGAVIYADVMIGRNCLICSNTVIREGCTIGNNCIIANGVTLNYDAWIGNNVKIMDNTHITGGMVIENNAFVSCLVATSNDNSMGRHNGTACDPPIICEKAVIGAGANILPGVVIGRNSTVAAGSVVTKDVKENALVLGVPARERIKFQKIAKGL